MEKHSHNFNVEKNLTTKMRVENRASREAPLFGTDAFQHHVGTGHASEKYKKKKVNK